MEVRLVVVAPSNQERACSVTLPALVGRSAAATLHIPLESVSRRHCEIFSTAGSVFIRDLGSTNGTRIGNDRLSASAAIVIEPGSVIRVGEAAFRVEYEPVDPPPQPAVDTALVPETAPLPDLPAGRSHTVAEEPAAFDFLAPRHAPPASDDAGLDDFLKGLP